MDRTLFRVAPLLMMSPALMSLAVIPFGQHLAARNINVGLLMIFAFGSINVMAIMLGGWSSRNKYAIISAARVVSQNVAYEIPMLLVVITMIMVTGTMNLNEIVAQQAGAFWHWNLFRVWVNPLMPVTFLIFYTCMLAETNRAPFDMAEAESELVAGAYTEYAGMGFGVFFMAEYANILLGCAPGHGAVPGRLAEPIGNLLGGGKAPSGLLGCLVPGEDVLPDLLRGVDSLDVPAHPVLRAAQPLLEDPHPGLAVHPDTLQRDDEAVPRMKNSLKEIATGFNSLVTGMRITLGQFFKPTVTVQYPHESLKMPERFRGHIELVRDPETGKANVFRLQAVRARLPQRLHHG